MARGFLPVLILAYLLGLVAAEGLYDSKSPVTEVTSANYNSLVAKSNHTWVCAFYQLLYTTDNALDSRILRAVVWSLQELEASI